MKIHKEGYKTIIITAILLGLINSSFFYYLGEVMQFTGWIILIASIIIFLFIVSFFRSPERKFTISHPQIICPADGKVVVIEEIFDTEYFNDKRLQVSIFMSPANVHINRIPISGEVVYSQYHKGRYLVAWNPKSSTENERHSVVIKNEATTILVKQIAGALAKRIVNYLKVGQEVSQGAEMGFIKFGSRVDVLLPLNTTVDVHLNQIVKGGVTVLATI
jgi:phosphatidylserine decarboxylase